ncbi:hypothetical protein [Desulfonatronovibrio magnus]|uniref:hypothetical protein n=1 Tax=Desulfonatronovibrio magnus TaxID=698827 RepID=UPI0005EB7299|nr:hypothetical protein [Desulfonatronovibrio magnus]
MLGFAFLSTFTTGDDVVGPDQEEPFQTTDNDDTIIAVSDSVPNGTLNPNDIIDGGDGHDTLQVEMKANFNGFNADKGLTSVEAVELTNTTSFDRTFNAKNIEDVQNWTIDAGARSFNLTNLAEIPSVIELTQSDRTFKATFAEEVLDGDNDELKVALNEVGSDDKSVKIEVTPDGTEALEVVSVEAIADTSNNINLAGTAVETINLSGAGDLKITAVDAGLEVFNGSGMTGDINADLSGATVEEVSGGAGDDTIKVSKADQEAVFSGGDGNDNLILNVGGSKIKGNLDPTINGFQTLTLDL